MIGQQLHTFLMPRHVQHDLAGEGLFVEVGMDEALLHLPWELMHDGHNFLCLKHALGRFVNADVPMASMAQLPSIRLGSAAETLSVLLICVPAPEPREDGTIYDPLPEAEAETDALVDILSEQGAIPSILKKRDATFDGVWDALSRNQYHIIHYSGHAHFDDEHPYRSGLVLQDTDMTTGELKTTISQHPPILCFINGCETGRATTDSSLKQSLNIYGLARAFLDTGAYLIGSRWKVNDRSAAKFAEAFYASLVAEGTSMGNAIIDARQACRRAVPEDVFGWSSYVFYGDPRVCFRMP
jgi:CHAT domain-containing protein